MNRRLFSSSSDRTSEYAEKLKVSAENDFRAGFTTVGIHRDDIGAYINGQTVPPYGFQSGVPLGKYHIVFVQSADIRGLDLRYGNFAPAAVPFGEQEIRTS